MAKDTDVQPKKTVNIYISYAQDDESIYEQLRINLNGLRNIAKTSLVNPYGIDITTSQDIVAGIDIAGLRETNLNAAHIILLLISPTFIYDTQCLTDMYNGLKRAKSGDPTVRTIPIRARAVSDSIWNDLPVYGMQALPRNGKPIPDRSNSRDQILSEVTTDLISVIKDLLPSIPLVARPVPAIQFTDPIAPVKGPGKAVPASKYSEAEIHRHTLILRDELARLYDDVDDIRTVLYDARIQARNVNLRAAPTVIWTSVLQEAQKHMNVLELVTVVERDYPESNVLRSEKLYWQGYSK